jgi:hypothetical protein
VNSNRNDGPQLLRPREDDDQKDLFS